MLYWIKRLGGLVISSDGEPVEVPRRAIIAALALGMLVGAATAPAESDSDNAVVSQPASVSFIAEPVEVEPVPRS